LFCIEFDLNHLPVDQGLNSSNNLSKTHDSSLEVIGEVEPCDLEVFGIGKKMSSNEVDFDPGKGVTFCSTANPGKQLRKLDQ
jgi:hypothetical protein